VVAGAVTVPVLVGVPPPPQDIAAAIVSTIASAKKILVNGIKIFLIYIPP
jgi:hypothetical protein